MTFDEAREQKSFTVKMPNFSTKPGWAIVSLRPYLIEVRLFEKYFTADDVDTLIRSLRNGIEVSKRMSVVEEQPVDREAPVGLPPQELIADFLKNHPCVSASYISRGLGIAKEKVVAIIQEFIVLGQVELAKKPVHYGYRAGRWGVRYKLREEKDGSSVGNLEEFEKKCELHTTNSKEGGADRSSFNGVGEEGENVI